MNMVDKDTLAFIAVFTGNAQTITPDQAAKLGSSREVLHFLVTGRGQEAAVADLMSNPAALDKAFQSVIALIDGLQEGRRTGRNNFSHNVTLSELYKLAKLGLGKETAALIELQKQAGKTQTALKAQLEQNIAEDKKLLRVEEAKTKHLQEKYGEEVKQHMDKFRDYLANYEELESRKKKNDEIEKERVSFAEKELNQALAEIDDERPKTS